MKVIAIASPKGGSGKTTLASALAVRAAMESGRVGMFDLNSDQGNLTQWWVLRGEPMNPRLIEVEHITRDVEVLRASRFEWLIIDTPPLELDIIENAVLKADCVLIPVRASIFDIGSITPIVEMARQRHKPYAFVLSAVDSRFKKLTERAMAALVSEGPICATRISYRQPYISALTGGKAGHEVEEDLRPEIDSLWGEVKRLALGAQPATRRTAAHG
jgi:chromosome partitioning protein